MFHFGIVTLFLSLGLAVVPGDNSRVSRVGSAHLVGPEPAGATGAFQSPCTRPASRVWPVGDTLIIRSGTTLPCELSFRDLPVELRVDRTSVEWIGGWISRDARGRIYSYSGYGTFSVWNPDGSLRLTRGREGQGPGEFEQGALAIHPRRDGSLWVYGGGRQWNIYDSTYQLTGSLRYTGGANPRYSTFLDDGLFLKAYQKQGNATIETLRFAVDGQSAGPNMIQTVRSFGIVSDSELAAATGRSRLLAYVGGDTIWVGPPLGTGRGYEIELWNTNGTLLRVIRREASWFRQGSDRAAPGSRLPAPSMVSGLFALGDGILVVVTIGPNSRWPEVAGGYLDRAPRPIPRPGEPSSLAAGRDVFVEAIDTESGVLLASLGPISSAAAEKLVPQWWFQGSYTGYRQSESPGGSETIRLIEVVLSGR